MRTLTKAQRAEVALRKAAADWERNLTAPVLDPADRLSKKLDAALKRAAVRYAHTCAETDPVCTTCGDIVRCTRCYRRPTR